MSREVGQGEVTYLEYGQKRQGKAGRDAKCRCDDLFAWRDLASCDPRSGWDLAFTDSLAQQQRAQSHGADIQDAENATEAERKDQPTFPSDPGRETGRCQAHQREAQLDSLETTHIVRRGSVA